MTELDRINAAVDATSDETVSETVIALLKTPDPLTDSAAREHPGQDAPDVRTGKGGTALQKGLEEAPSDHGTPPGSR
ncbi:hypothetical protein ACFYYM_37620 [Streptomyces erythrochromogenes]|uniref:hypothetical protein n=1 Tax=Streptomyces erythrochromogenes TaxID=285574 RepID=UPI003683550F